MKLNTTLLPVKPLTSREVEVLTLTAYGKTRKDISKILLIADRTTKEHLGNACRKLNAINKTHAVVLAIGMRIIAPYVFVSDPPSEVRRSFGLGQMANIK